MPTARFSSRRSRRPWDWQAAEKLPQRFPCCRWVARIPCPFALGTSAAPSKGRHVRSWFDWLDRNGSWRVAHGSGYTTNGTGRFSGITLGIWPAKAPAPGRRQIRSATDTHAQIVQPGQNPVILGRHALPKAGVGPCALLGATAAPVVGIVVIATAFEIEIRDHRTAIDPADTGRPRRVGGHPAFRSARDLARTPSNDRRSDARQEYGGQSPQPGPPPPE